MNKKVETICWVCNIEEVEDKDWNNYLSIINKEDKERVLKFRFFDDQKRALLSVYLQHALVRQHVRATNDSDYKILRTREVR